MHAGTGFMETPRSDMDVKMVLTRNGEAVEGSYTLFYSDRRQAPHPRVEYHHIDGESAPGSAPIRMALGK